MKTLRFSSLALLLLFALSACNKEDSLDNDFTSAIDNSTAEGLFDDLGNMVESRVQQESELNGFHPSLEPESDSRCANISVSTTPGTVFPATVVFDFGSGCTFNGRTRSGSVTATLSAPVHEPGATLTISASNYTVDGYAVSGTRSTTNNGLNAQGQLSYTVVVEDGYVQLPNGDDINWEVTRTSTWVDGQGTTYASHGMDGVLDDVFSITGAANGISRNDVPFTAQIGSPLIAARACDWITSGTLAITPQGAATRTLDYGDGACDDQATVSVGPFSQDITLP